MISVPRKMNSKAFHWLLFILSLKGGQWQKGEDNDHLPFYHPCFTLLTFSSFFSWAPVCLLILRALGAGAVLPRVSAKKRGIVSAATERQLKPNQARKGSLSILCHTGAPPSTARSGGTLEKTWGEGTGNERGLKTHSCGGNSSLGGVVPGKRVHPRFLLLQA